MFSQSWFSHIFLCSVCLNDCVNCGSVEVCPSPLSRLPTHSNPSQCVPLLMPDFGGQGVGRGHTSRASSGNNNLMMDRKYNNTLVFPVSHKACSVSDKAQVCHCVGSDSESALKKTSQSVVCVVSTGRSALVEQGYPFIQSIHRSTWLSGTDPFLF